MTNHYKKIKPRFFNHTKDGGFCFTGLGMNRNSERIQNGRCEALPSGRTSPLLGGEASNHELKKGFACSILDDTNL